MQVVRESYDETRTSVVRESRELRETQQLWKESNDDC